MRKPRVCVKWWVLPSTARWSVTRRGVGTIYRKETSRLTSRFMTSLWIWQVLSNIIGTTVSVTSPNIPFFLKIVTVDWIVFFSGMNFRAFCLHHLRYEWVVFLFKLMSRHHLSALPKILHFQEATHPLRGHLTNQWFHPTALLHTLMATWKMRLAVTNGEPWIYHVVLIKSTSL